jgi:hypothetical protein
MTKETLGLESVYPSKSFMDRLPMLLRWTLLIPIFILSIYISRIIFDFFINVIFTDSILSGRNQWNDYVFNFENINDFLNNWWIIFCEEFLVLFLSINISLNLLPDEKKTTGFYLLVFIQLIFYILLILIGVLGKNIGLFPAIFVLISYSLPFLFYYYQELYEN